MRIHYLQHVPFEGPGVIADWAREQGHPLSATALYADEPLPEQSAFDFLVVLGGPMGVHDTSAYGWMTREKHFIEESLRLEKRVLGICLGAQLIADVLGAKVYSNPHKEIGWFQVVKTPETADTQWADILPDQFSAFHWHGDTFDLPNGALHLARSEACRHQAFFYPPAAVGLQFHLESSQESVEQLMHHCSRELVPGPYVQSRVDILKQHELIPPSNEGMRRILNYFQYGSGSPVPTARRTRSST